MKLPANAQSDYNPDDNRTSLLYGEGEYAFAIDHSVARDMGHRRIASIGDALLVDGKLTSGGTLTIDGDGTAHLEPAQLYTDGLVRDLGAATIALPEGQLFIGVMLAMRVVPGEPFINPAYLALAKPRAAQVEEVPSWALSTQVPDDTPETSYRFFPIYEINDRQLVAYTPPPELTGFDARLARYDRQANGHYVVEGLDVAFVSKQADKSLLSVKEGLAHVWGLEVIKPNATPFDLPFDPDLEIIKAEPHYFNDGGSGSLTITLNRTPIAQISDISVLEEKTVEVKRGLVAGGRDALPDAQIAGIVEIKQGDTTFVTGNDYHLFGDEVDWSKNGGEPATGSTYQVTYRYKRSIDADAQTSTSVTISGAVTGTQVEIDYSHQMPRIDLLVLDRDGVFKRVKGVSRPYRPQVPQAAPNDLTLAQIHHTWDGDPTLVNVAVRRVPVSEQERTRELAITAMNEVGRLQLQLEAGSANGYAKSSIWVDNFIDDSQRDAGVDQTLEIVSGFLTLPLTATLIHDLGDGIWQNTYDYEEVLVQQLATGSMKVNPYQAFEPLPAKVKLTPASDQWAQNVTKWRSAITQRLSDVRRFIGSGQRARTNSDLVSTSATQVLSSQQRAAELLRVRDVAYEIAGFEAGERLIKIRFDGRDLPLPDPAPIADQGGVLVGAFTIPDGVPAGSKLVEFLGDQGSFGEASYIGRGTITVTEMRRVTTTRRILTTRRFDPLGYIWTPQERMPLGAVSVKVTDIGNPDNPIILQVRETLASQPTGLPLAEVELDMHGVKVGDILRFELPMPLWLEAGTEYAHVWLSDDPTHALAIARLGKRDPDHGWVRAQPNVNMVCISSSNNTAFSYHHDRDLWTVIEKAVFTSTKTRVDLGALPATIATDLLALAGVEHPSAETRVELILTRPDSSEIRMLPGEVINLPEELNEELQVSVELVGTNAASPVMLASPQLVLAQIEQSGSYVSRAFKCGDNRTVEITSFERTPGASSFELAIRTADDNWLDVPLHAQENHGDGWHKKVYRRADVSTPETAVRITAKGSARDRPIMAYIYAAPLDVSV
ncbi:DUF4815 domain-containing protein [Polycladidibacter stylochi]|uniref:DUF4815 domain-containing protein n=1 Tax=Polycladidibacter stylochi TaxID=1807766 RepID=UPI0008336A24|nr:DUF4815 domain-containing protein [Pseudovibrio stylochi]